MTSDTSGPANAPFKQSEDARRVWCSRALRNGRHGTKCTDVRVAVKLNLTRYAMAPHKSSEELLEGSPVARVYNWNSWAGPTASRSSRRPASSARGVAARRRRGGSSCSFCRAATSTTTSVPNAAQRWAARPTMMRPTSTARHRHHLCPVAGVARSYATGFMC